MTSPWHWVILLGLVLSLPLLILDAARWWRMRAPKAVEATETPERKEIRHLRMYMNLILPGVYQYQSRYAGDWRHPVKELDLRIDHVLRALVIMAYWKDGTVHQSYLTLAELTANANSAGWVDVFRAKMNEVCPESVFHDEIVVAYADTFEQSNWPAETQT